MDEIKRFRLAIGGVALLAMVGLTWWGISSRTGDTPAADASEAPSLPEIERDEITQIEIRRPEDEAAIRLVRDGDTWTVAAPIEAAASQATIDTALDKLADLELRGVATSRSAHHERLEVDEEHGVHVIARAGDSELIDMWIGASSNGDTMVRLDGRDEVLMVDGPIKFAFNKPLRDWRDKAIVGLESANVREVTFTNTNGTFHFRKNGEDWEQVLEATEEGAEPPPGIERFAPTKVGTSVSSIARLRATDFAAADVTAEAAGLGDGAARVTLVSGEGDEAETLTLRVGNEVEEGQRYVQREGNETIFIVSRFVAQKLIPDAAAFQEPEPGEEGEQAEGETAEPGAAPGGGQIPPEVMEQLRRQLQQQGHAPH